MIEAVSLRQLDDGSVALFFGGDDSAGVAAPRVEKVVPEKAAQTEIDEGGEGVDVRVNVDEPCVVEPAKRLENVTMII